MIDGNNTTHEWQSHAGDICVLPVGSVEQHGMNMPLMTDCIEGEFFARMIAEDLNAALLPTLYYANCLEHSGFRGSVSLHPETLMLVVRDLADEMERQNFRILIILNGHGGNFALVPVARDINRLDRPIKIILVNFWEFCAPEIGAEKGGEIHAGEWETSLMLAIRPELVKEAKPGMDMKVQADQDYPLERRDLTTFGTGHFNPTGAIGFPSLGNKEKGRAIIASISEHMLPYVRDRIERLRKMPRYSG